MQGVQMAKVFTIIQVCPSNTTNKHIFAEVWGKLGQLFCIPSGRKVSLSHLEHPTNCGSVQRSRFDVITLFTGPKEGNFFDRTTSIAKYIL